MEATVPYPRAGDNAAFAEWLGDAEGSASPTEAESKRGPGRPPGTGKNQRAAAALNEYQAAGLDDAIMAAVWKGVFQAAALMLDAPALLLKDNEATALARPSCVLWGYYMPTAISPTQAAWSQLGLTLFGIIGIRADAIRQGMQRRKTAANEPIGSPSRPSAAPPAGADKPDIPRGKVKFAPAGTVGDNRQADGSA